MGRKSIWEQPDSNTMTTHTAAANPWRAENEPQAVGDLIPEARKRVDRREREPVATFYGIPAEVHQELKKTADSLGVPVGDVARFFFEHGLAAMFSGKLRVEARLSEGRRTLFPTDGGARMPASWGAPPTPKQAAATKKRKKKAGKVSYRGVPREVIQAMQGAAERLKAPVGELARKLLEWGLAEYAAGRLTMTAYVEPDSCRNTLAL